METPLFFFSNNFGCLHIQDFFSTRQRFAKLKRNDPEANAPIQLKMVLKEFRFEEGSFPLWDALKELFTQKRKLKPKVVKEEKLTITSLEEV